MRFYVDGSTLTLDGGQNGAGTADTITVSDTASGAVTATLDGENVWFDPGVISNVIVNATLLTTVNVDGTWSPGTGVTINAGASNTVTINVSPDAENLNNFAGYVTVTDPDHRTVLNLDDQANTANNAWSLSGWYYGFGNSILVEYAIGSPGEVTVNKGASNDYVYVDSTACPTYINLGGGTNLVYFSPVAENLSLIQAPVFVSGVSTYNALFFEDQSNPASENVTFENGYVWENGMAPVYYSGSYNALFYYAGSGNDILSAAPTSENMDDLIPDIAIYGGSGRDSLTVNDKAHTSTNETANQYTVSDSQGVGSIARTYNFKIGTTIHYDLGETITYTSLSGGVTLDTDNIGTPVDVEGTLASIPTTVDVGTGNTTVTLAAAGQSLAAFGSGLTLNGGTGSDSLVVDDQKDRWLRVRIVRRRFLLGD